MNLKDCRYDGHGDFKLEDHPTSAHIDKALKQKYLDLEAKNTARMAELQDRFYADGHEGLVILFQAMDAAGKDSTIKHVMSGVNPQGVNVYSFKQPSHEELAHGYLWRANRHLPERGHIAIFNRSYYEDVLVVRVHELQKTYALPKRCTDMSEDEFFDRRYRQIVGYERYLSENGHRVLKFFLNVGQDEQKKRFLERIDNPSKNWKFSSSDLTERALWPKYMDAYEKAIGATATEDAPWYVIPADQKWYARWLVSEAIVKTLEACDSRYPVMPPDQVAHLADCKAKLLGVSVDELAAQEAATAAAALADPVRVSKKDKKKAKKAEEEAERDAKEAKKAGKKKAGKKNGGSADDKPADDKPADVEPTAPAEPVAPVVPEAAPAVASKPVRRRAPRTPAEPADPAAPASPRKPVASRKAAEPADPVDPASKPVRRRAPRKAAASAEPAGPVDPAEPRESAGPVESAEPAGQKA